MAMYITPAETAEITKVVCPDCRTKVWGVGLLQNSSVTGLTFRCRKCGKLWAVKTEKSEKPT